LKRYRLPLAAALASLVVASIVSVSQAQAPDAAQIPWSAVTADAFVAAHRTGKPILVYVTAEKCAFCRKMERETWSDPAIAKMVEAGFVPLKLHADTHPNEIATLKIRAFPATVLVTPQGKPFAGRVGFVDSAKLVEMLQPAVAAAPAIRQPAL
jgi:uncharacterized protein YyaL (SSP411 family)